MNSLRRSYAMRHIGRQKRQTEAIVRFSSIFTNLPEREAMSLHQEKVDWKNSHNIAIPSLFVDEFKDVPTRVPILRLPLSSSSSSSLTDRSYGILSSHPFVGTSSSELAALEDATKNLLIELWQSNASRIGTSFNNATNTSSSLRGGGGESHRKRRNQDRYSNIPPTQSPWLQQFAQFSTSPSPPESPPESSTPPSLSVAARTAPRPALPHKHKLDPTRIPTPPSGPQPDNPLESLKKTNPRSIVRKGVDIIISAFTTLLRFVFQLPGNLFYYLTHPAETRKKYAEMKQMVKDEVHHYWVGFKVRCMDG